VNAVAAILSATGDVLTRGRARVLHRGALRVVVRSGGRDQRADPPARGEGRKHARRARSPHHDGSSAAAMQRAVNRTISGPLTR
jgi:hypothetical protein